MQTKVYVDVLLVLNYIISLALLLCTARITGKKPKRRRIVAAALLGSASALTIFLPFFGFWTGIFAKFFLSAAIVAVAFATENFRSFVKQWLAFFVVNFFFAGVMLAVWIALAPAGMLFYNGIVYFNLSSSMLIVTTCIAYAALCVAHRISRGGRLKKNFYRVEVDYDGRSVSVQALVDTGNSLYEPFSDAPVIVCGLSRMAPLLPPGAAEAILRGEHMTSAFQRFGLRLRMIPYRTVDGAANLPAFSPDRLRLFGPGGAELSVQRVYVALSTQPVGGDGYEAILNPDLVAFQAKNKKSGIV